MQSSCWWKTLPLVVSRLKQKKIKKLKKKPASLTRSTEPQQKTAKKKKTNNILKLLACA